MSGATPPSIGRIEVWRRFRAHRYNYIDMYAELRERFGDVVRVEFPTRRYLIFHPDHVRHVLRDNAKNYHKSKEYSGTIGPLLGRGLLSSDGALWRQQRKLVAPEFQPQNLHAFEGLIVRSVEATARTWSQADADGAPRDITDDMMALTLRVVGEAFFGSEIGPYADEVRDALTTASEEAVWLALGFIRFPFSWPTPRNRRFLRAVKVLDRIILEQIAERQAKGFDTDGRKDVLSRLVAASTQDMEFPVDATLLRDELVTMLVAGHETTTLAVSWALYRLTQHPEIARTMRDELTTVLDGRVPGLADLPKLHYTRMVLMETLRLYTPLPAVSRTPIEDDIVGGFRLEAGSMVSCPLAVTHRHPDFWEEPDAFRPDRFVPEAMRGRHPFAYVPFGAGPRICAGEHFGTLEAMLALAYLVPRFSLELAPGHPVEPLPLLTLRPKHGIRARIRAVAPHPS